MKSDSAAMETPLIYRRDIRDSNPPKSTIIVVLPREYQLRGSSAESTGDFLLIKKHIWSMYGKGVKDVRVVTAQ